MTKQMNISLRELGIKGLEDYLYWNHPLREFHKLGLSTWSGNLRMMRLAEKLCLKKEALYVILWE